MKKLLLSLLVAVACGLLGYAFYARYYSTPPVAAPAQAAPKEPSGPVPLPPRLGLGAGGPAPRVLPPPVPPPAEEPVDDLTPKTGHTLPDWGKAPPPPRKR